MGPVVLCVLFVYPDGCRRLHNQSSDWCSEGVLSESVSTVSQARNCLSLRFLFYFFCAVVFECQLSLLASTVSDSGGGGDLIDHFSAARSSWTTCLPHVHRCFDLACRPHGNICISPELCM